MTYLTREGTTSALNKNDTSVKSDNTSRKNFTKLNPKRNLCGDNGDNTIEIGDVSLCPWTMIIEENRFRQPIRMKQAECVFERPLAIPGLVCRPVYRDTEVIIWNKKTIERVPVACIAVPLCDWKLMIYSRNSSCCIIIHECKKIIDLLFMYIHV